MNTLICVLMLIFCFFCVLAALAIFCKATNEYFEMKNKIDQQKIDIICDALKRLYNE